MVDVSEGIVIFSSDFCPFCIRAKSLLSAKSIEYTEVRVDGQPQVRAEMAEMAGKTSVPQIWIHGKHVGGCDDLMLLERLGTLDEMLAAQ